MTSAAAGCGCVVVWRDALRHALCAVPIWASRGHEPETSSPNAQHAAGEQHLPSSCIHQLHLSIQLPAVIPNFGWMEQLFLSGMLGTSILWSKDPCRKIHNCF